MRKIIEEAFTLGSTIAASNPMIQVDEVFHYHDGPQSFTFTVSGDDKRFHAELLQTFRDEGSVWAITEYYGEFDGMASRTPMSFRNSIIDLIKQKDHVVAIVDVDFRVQDVAFRVKGTYPYSIFEILYNA